MQLSSFNYTDSKQYLTMKFPQGLTFSLICCFPDGGLRHFSMRVLAGSSYLDCSVLWSNFDTLCLRVASQITMLERPGQIRGHRECNSSLFRLRDTRSERF